MEKWGIGFILGAIALGVTGCSGSETQAVDDTAGEAKDVGQGEEALRAPFPPGLRITASTAFGSGCPDPGTVSVTIGPDEQSFVVVFSNMTLPDPGPPPWIQSKSCVATLTVDVPPGFQINLSDVLTQGYALLARGQRARITSRYSFPGVAGPTFVHPLTGPVETFYSYTDTTGILTWSECGADVLLSLNTTLVLDYGNNHGDSAILNTDIASGRFRNVLHIGARPC